MSIETSETREEDGTVLKVPFLECASTRGCCFMTTSLSYHIISPPTASSPTNFSKRCRGCERCQFLFAYTEYVRHTYYPRFYAVHKREDGNLARLKTRKHLRQRSVHSPKNRVTTHSCVPKDFPALRKCKIQERKNSSRQMLRAFLSRVSSSKDDAQTGV